MMLVVLYISVITIHLSATEITNHPGWEVLNKFECGDSAADRIIGGTNAILGQFPWIARLGFINSYDEFEEVDYMCGGALITDRHVVTAAHCVSFEDDSEIQLKTIRLGEHDSQTDPDCELGICAPPAQDRGVKNIYPHRNYNNPPFHNDIAIIELEKPVELNDFVEPICLPKYDEQLKGVVVGDMVSAAGWGKMNMTTEERAKILQVVALPVVDPKMCDMFGNGFTLKKSEICAGAHHNKDACGGDSGGPLMKVYDTPDGPKHFLVGVVSFGPTVCGIKKPAVYSSVPHFLNWILDALVRH